MATKLFSSPLITFVSPEAGRWKIIALFDKEVESILYDPTKKGVFQKALDIYPFPYKQKKVKLRFTEFVTDKETAKNEMSKDGKKKKYISIREFYGSTLFIGTREEEVDYLRQIEAHPAVAEVIASDGGSLEIILSIAVEIYDDALPCLKLEDFLGFAQNLVIEAIRGWASKKTNKEIRQINADSFQGSESEIKINNIFYRDYINTTILSKYNLKIAEVNAVQVVVAERSIDILESEEDITKQKNEAEAAIHEASTRKNLLVATKAENDEFLRLQNRMLTNVQNFVKNTSQNFAAINKAWGEGGLKTLFMGGQNTNNGQQVIQEAVIQANSFMEEAKENMKQQRVNRSGSKNFSGKKKGGQND